MRRALIVGIDDYPAAPLAGCVADAKLISGVLEFNDDRSRNFDCKLITSDNTSVSRARLTESIVELLADPADVALFHFSGHGIINSTGGYLVTTDVLKYAEGLRMSDLLHMANKATHIKDIVILLDCCHSGALGAIPAIDPTAALLREGLTILSASRASQSAFEIQGANGIGGVFSSLIAGALEGGAADVLGVVSAAGMYAYVDQALGAWQQRPLYKAHVSRLVPVRSCTPPIDVAILRKLPKYFPDPSARFGLDPTYEDTCGHGDREHEAVFKELQKLSRVRLVIPIAADHMYDAACQSTGCQMTPLGRYYWQLANTGRL